MGAGTQRLGEGVERGMETMGDEVRERMEVQITWSCKDFGPKGPNIRALSRDIM